MSNSKQAEAVAQKFKTKTVFENSKGEFFTQNDLAVFSEKGDATKITTHQFDAVPSADEQAAAAALKAEKEKAALIAKIAKAKSVKDVDSLVGESVDADVVTAANDKKAELAK
jgi:hypothetical protein